MLPSTVFQGAEHESFLMRGGKPAAVLVHGFPGTPADIRPLSDSLVRLGLTVSGVLLPGFGPQIETLPKRTYPEWLAAIRAEIARLRAEGHDPIILGGHSMGAALSLHLAATLDMPLAGLILIAPFVRIDNPLWSLMPLLKRVFPEFRPFRLLKLDFNNPEVRAGIATFMPDADLDQPDVQMAIKNFRLPLSLFDQVRQIGLRCAESAPKVTLPCLIVQGSQDTLVKPSSTRQLISRYGGEVSYYEVDAEHNLIVTAAPYWKQIEVALASFLSKILPPEQA